jgi:hypothetical protein
LGIERRYSGLKVLRLPESISSIPALTLVLRGILLLLIATILRGQDPAILQIKVTEGEGSVYAVGGRATRGLTVQVTDEAGKPVEGASVSFRLPDSGPAGTFASGSKTEIVTTGADGRAGVWGMQWNRTAGALEVRITALKGQTRAGTTCSIYLSDSPEARASTARAGPKGHKWVWIALAVGGAAAAGVAVAAVAGKPAPASATPQGFSIGSPSIILGHP